MRIHLAMTLFLALIAPSAAALGFSSAVVRVDVDAPLLAPVHIEQPLAPDLGILPSLTQDERPLERGPPTLPSSVPIVVDGELDGADLTLEIAPPRRMGGLDKGETLDRSERLDAPLGSRTLPSTPVDFSEPIRDQALPVGETRPARVISPAFAAAPSRAPAPEASAPVHSPPTPPAEAPTWRTAATLGAAALLLLAPLLLYHRSRGHHVGQSTARREVLAMLSTKPGANASEVARALRLDPSTVTYHLRRLLREHLIVAEGALRRQRYFVAGRHAPQDRLQLLASQRGSELLAVVREAPGLNQTRLAHRLAISRATTHGHLVALESAGLVRLVRTASRVRVFPISF